MVCIVNIYYKYLKDGYEFNTWKRNLVNFHSTSMVQVIEARMCNEVETQARESNICTTFQFLKEKEENK